MPKHRQILNNDPRCELLMQEYNAAAHVRVYSAHSL